MSRCDVGLRQICARSSAFEPDASPCFTSFMDRHADAYRGAIMGVLYYCLQSIVVAPGRCVLLNEIGLLPPRPRD